MISEFSLLRLYEDIKKDSIKDSELKLAASDLVRSLSVLKKSDDLFSTNVTILNESLEMLMADEPLFKSVFPNSNYKFFKSEAARLIKQYEGVDFDAPEQFEDQIMLLEKSQVGKTIKEDIFGAISEYEKSYKAGFASPAEILTLSRFYPDRPDLQAAISKFPHEPMVIGGPASVEMVDKEGHLITTEALDEAFKKYMTNYRTRNIMVLHSDVQTGWALPAYINKAGQVFRSGVDDKGLYLISEVRDDIRVAQKVQEQVETGKLRSYSIAGSALDVDQINDEHGKTIMRVNKLDLVEITICERGVNPGAHFDILKSHYHPEKSCADGSCLTAFGMKITGEKDGQVQITEIMEVAQPTREAGGTSFQPTGEVAMSGNEILKGTAVERLQSWIQKNLKGKGFLLEDALEGNSKKRKEAHEADNKRLGFPEDTKKIVEQTEPDPKKFYEPGKVSADGQIPVKKSCS